MRVQFDGIVQCPACSGGTLSIPPEREAQTACRACGTAYPIHDGVLDLLADGHQVGSRAQALMESSRVVQVYEGRWVRRNPFNALRTGASFDREYEMITHAMKLTGRETLLDLACGTGIYARPLARSLGAGSVIGFDLSAPMLSYASRAAHAERIENLLLVHGDAMRLPFVENTFDVVNCCGALHLFPDVPAVLGRVSRALKPGGRFTVATVLKRANRLAEWLVQRRRQFAGIDAFRPDELESLFAQVGLRNFQVYHAKGIWLIVSASKSE